MRLIVLFDLPVITSKERREYTRFRKFLLEDGYTMIQFSIYSRICNGQDNVQKHIRRLKKHLPPVAGAIRSLAITEKQYQNMDILLGEKQIEEELGTKKVDFF